MGMVKSYTFNKQVGVEISNSYVVNTNKYERFIECIKKGAYGLSRGMLRGPGSFIKHASEGDTLFLKLNYPPHIIAGPFCIISCPKNLPIIKSISMCFKVDINNITPMLPWWAAEGFDWLVFFKTKTESKYAEIGRNINIPDLCKLSEETRISILKLLGDKGEHLNGLSIIK